MPTSNTVAHFRHRQIPQRSDQRGPLFFQWYGARLRALTLTAVFAAGLAMNSVLAQAWLEGPLPGDENVEIMSPEDILPSSVEPGLSNTRAIPAIPPPKPGPEYRRLYQLTRPFYDSILLDTPIQYFPNPDPSTFRPVTAYVPPIGLQPRKYRTGLLEIYPTFGISQSFDSNVNLSANDPIADFYITPRAKIELQLGTPDSAWTERYDTILALNLNYEIYADLFYLNPSLSALNQKFSLTTRIGRASAIWRPYVYFSDVTGTDLLTTELTNRTRRIRVSPGVLGEYQLTNRISARQNFSYFYFGHPDPSYINFNVLEARQDLGYRVLNETTAFVWAGYRYTSPDRGSAGSEGFAGLGWRGKPDPRLFTELAIGYGLIDLEQPPEGALDSSGIRFNGYTTFQWGPRFAFTLIYDRNYVYNEADENDNYVSTLLQFKGEFYLGGNWYLTPYFGISFNEFQTSRALTMQYRPELEVSYVFPTDTVPGNIPGASRIFLKVAYSHSQNLRGLGSTIDGTRASLGFAWTY